jgi:TorA maturation chaperone TorD
MTDPSEMQATAAGRGQTYAILAALYSAPPSAELAALIRAGGLRQEGNTALAAAANALTDAFADKRTEAEIAAEHTRLFVLPSGVVPHESYYLDENQRVGGHVTVAVQRFYDAAAAQLTNARLELPDHIGVELEFMKFLCTLEAQFWQEPNEDGLHRCLDFQKSFLEAHLLRWHRKLCEKVLNESSLDTYRALACLTLEFLEAERVFVPESSKAIHSERRSTCVSES